MRKHLSSALLHSLVLIALALPLLVSCGKDDAPASSTDTVPSRNIPSGDISTPEWNVSPDYDYSSSMTAVVDVDLMQTYPDLTPAEWQVDTADLLGAFAGEECVGVVKVKPTDGLFFLFITAPTSSEEDIALRYYSTRLHNIFQADIVLHFENGARLGSVNDPLKPGFTN